MIYFHKFEISKISAIFEIVFANLIENRQTSLFYGIWREIRKKSNQKFAGKMQNSMKKMKTIGNSIIQSRKHFGDF